MSGPNDQKMREREKKGAMTIAMGMKMTQASSECWCAQVRKEKQIAEEWEKHYAPDWHKEAEEIARRVEAKDAELKAAPPRPEREQLFDGVSKDGKGRAAYLKALRNRNLADRTSQPLTSSQVVGWKTVDIPPPKNPALPSYGHKPVIQNGFYRKRGVF